MQSLALCLSLRLLSRYQEPPLCCSCAPPGLPPPLRGAKLRAGHGVPTTHLKTARCRARCCVVDARSHCSSLCSLRMKAELFWRPAAAQRSNVKGCAISSVLVASLSLFRSRCRAGFGQHSLCQLAGRYLCCIQCMHALIRSWLTGAPAARSRRIAECRSFPLLSLNTNKPPSRCPALMRHPKPPPCCHAAIRRWSSGTCEAV